MPIVNYGDEYDSLAAAPAIDLGRETATPVESPDLLTALGASFRRDNIIGSTLSSETLGLNRYEREDGFNPLNEIKGTKYEARAQDAASIFNRRYFDAWKMQVDREDEDRRIQDGAGWLGTGTSALAAILDLPTFIPGGAAVRGAAGGISIARSAASVAVAGGVGAAASEAGLQATQQTRTAGETAVALGSGVVFGGLLGAGVGALMSRLEQRAAVSAIDGIRAATRDGTALSPVADEVERIARQNADSSVGAARVTGDSIEDLTIAGDATRKYAESIAGLNPNLRALTSPSRAHREVMTGMMENSVYLKKNLEGRGEAAVETLQKQWDRGALAAATQRHREIFSEARGAGLDMTPEQFDEAISFAMRRGDEGSDPVISRAAQEWRTKVFDPLKNQAIEVGLLPPDVDVKTAESYLMRVWNPRKIEAQEGEFRRIATDHVREWVNRAVQKFTQTRDNRLARINSEIADLELPADQRAALLQSLPQDLKALREANPRFTSLDEDLSIRRSELAKHTAVGDRGRAATLTKEIDQLVADAGTDYADYVTKRNVLQTRLSRVRNNVVGAQNRIATLQARAADVEAANIERLRRLHRSLTILDEDIEKSSPEMWQEKLAKAKTLLANVLDRSSKAQERLMQAHARDEDRLALREPGRSPNAAQKPDDDLFSLLDSARLRVGADPSRKLPKYPVLDILAKAGGVDPTSPLAGELRAMGITNKTRPGLFRKDGRGAADNFVKEEYPLFEGMGDDGNGYVDQRNILEAIRSELSGSPIRTIEQHEAIDAYAARTENQRLAEETLAEMGIDLSVMGNDAVLRRLSEVQGDRNYLAELDQIPLPNSADEYGAVAPEEVTKRQAAIMERMTRRDRLFEAAERKRTQLAAERADRIADLESMDPEAAVAELRVIVESRLTDAARLIERETLKFAQLAQKATNPETVAARVKGLKERAAQVERDFADRVEIGLDADNDYEGYVTEVVDGIYNQLTGRNAVDVPRDIVPAARGPLKERTFNIPDRLVEGFLENNIEMIARRYARTMSADIELTRRYGNATMVDQIAKVQEEYQGLRAEVIASDRAPSVKEKELKALNKREKSDVEDMKAVRDLLRGTYQAGANSSSFARIARAAQTFNYLRTMGGVVVGSLTDAVRPAMVHGMSAYMRDGIAPLIRNLDAVKLSAKDARLAGLVSERVLQSRMATMAELTDPYSSNSPFERFLDNAANKFTTLTGLNHWTDFQETIASVMTQNRVLKNAERGVANLKDRERAYMGYVGLDAGMADRVSRQFQQFGQNLDGVRVANVEDWTDDVARRAYLAAVYKDVSSTIVRKGVGDVPLFTNTPIGRALIQFKSFALASNQRVLMRGMQEGPARLMGGIAGMTAMGAFVYWLKQLESGREVSNNPGTWVAEGLDRSGIFSIGFEINNAIEKAGGPGVYSLLALGGQAVAPGSDAREPASRFATRSVVEGFLGPTVGLANDVVSLGSIPLRATGAAISPEEEFKLSPSDVQTARRLAPFASLPYWRWMIDGGFGFQYAPVPRLKEAVQ